MLFAVVFIEVVTVLIFDADCAVVAWLDRVAVVLLAALLKVVQGLLDFFWVHVVVAEVMVGQNHVERLDHVGGSAARSLAALRSAGVEQRGSGCQCRLRIVAGGRGAHRLGLVVRSLDGARGAEVVINVDEIFLLRHQCIVVAPAVHKIEVEEGRLADVDAVDFVVLAPSLGLLARRQEDSACGDRVGIIAVHAERVLFLDGKAGAHLASFVVVVMVVPSFTCFTCHLISMPFAAVLFAVVLVELAAFDGFTCHLISMPVATVLFAVVLVELAAVGVFTCHLISVPVAAVLFAVVFTKVFTVLFFATATATAGQTRI